MDIKKSKTYNLMTESLDAVEKKNEVSKLIEISPVESFNEEIQAILYAFYDHKKPHFRRLATVFNAVFTQENSVFTFSLGLAQKLIPLDSAMHGFGKPNDDAYNAMMHNGMLGGYFEKIREHTSNKAALYRITHPKILFELELLMGREAREAKENKFIEWWDSTNPEEKKAPRILTEEQKRVREIADGIFNNKRH
jgi:hypothetical protein